jgi:5-amino-6-(5-phosphoribosylamino)uracil reductase
MTISHHADGREPLSYDQLLELYPLISAQALRINMVVSLDGKIAVEGRSHGLSTPLDRQIFHFLRATAQVILVGAGTARTENYRAPQLSRELELLRQRLGMVRPLRIIIASNQRAPGWTPSTRATATTVSAVPARAQSAREQTPFDYRQIPPSIDGEGLADLLEVDPDHPGGILCEGGPTLFGNLLDRGLVDEFCMTLRHLVVGASSPPLVDQKLTTPIEFNLAAHITSEQATFLRLIKPN